MLETSDLLVLKRAFAYADHEFLRGFVYLTEESITSRIEEVDPSWSFDVMQIVYEGGNAIAHARLTIKGVSRDGIGMQKIMENAGEPAKGAVTDALKRCARLFGVGRYLLNAPKEGDEFKRWLADQQKATTAPRPTPPPTTAAPATGGNGESPSTLPTTAVGDDLDAAFDKALGNAPHIVVSSVEVKRGKNNKPFLTFERDGVRVTTFTRDPLRGVLDETQVGMLAEPGTYQLPTLRVFWKQDGEYKNVEKVERIA